MALVVADRVKETTNTTGTGTLTLLGAATGFQSFSAIGNGNSTFYTIVEQSGSAWEVGIGTYTSAGTTLSRTTVLSSSNSGSLVNFSAGTKDVFVSQPAERTVVVDGTTILPSNSGVLPLTNGGTGLTSFTANYIHYGSFSTSSSLQFDGTTMRVGSVAPLTGAVNPIVGMTGTANGYIQSYIYNSNTGISASADFTAYANNSTDAHGWADMGFTGANYADPTYTVTGPNEAYLFGSALNSSYTGNLVYATDSTGSQNYHQWYVGGFTQLKSAWVMQLTSTGLTCTGTITGNSDETLKTNWRDLPTDFIERLAKVKHGTYDRVDINLTQDGVSAQSLKPLLPNSVIQDGNGKLSVAYGNAALVAAIALAERVVQLEAVVAKLTQGAAK